MLRLWQRCFPPPEPVFNITIHPVCVRRIKNLTRRAQHVLFRCRGRIVLAPGVWPGGMGLELCVCVSVWTEKRPVVCWPVWGRESAVAALREINSSSEAQRLDALHLRERRAVVLTLHKSSEVAGPNGFGGRRPHVCAIRILSHRKSKSAQPLSVWHRRGVCFARFKCAYNPFSPASRRGAHSL